jgi:hypothetical protein
MSSSDNISNLKLSNQSESVQFEILEFGSFGGFETTQSDFSNSHKFSISNSVTMDDDDGAEAHLRFVTSTQSRVTKDMQDMNTMFESIKHHITNATQQLSGDFKQVVDSNSKFKQEVQEELKEMRQFLAEQKRLLGIQSSSDVTTAPTTSPATMPSVSSVPSTQNIAPPVIPQSVQSSTLASTTASQDINAQMLLLLLTDSFSKLSTALTEKSDSTKSDWPKFSGDHKKFRSWYLSIMAQLSLPPWKEFYDSSKNDVIISTTNSTLNGKLYSKLLLSLEGIALQSTVAKKHLQANGLYLLLDLVQTYKPKNVPEVIAAKTSEFWGTLKRYPS